MREIQLLHIVKPINFTYSNYVIGLFVDFVKFMYVYIYIIY